MSNRDDSDPLSVGSQLHPAGPAWVGRPVLRVVIGGLVVAAATVVMLVAPALVQGWQARQHPVVSPTHVDGLAVDDGPGAQDAVQRLRHALEKSLSVSTTGAAYTDDAGHRSVVFVGGTGSLVSPQVSLTTAFAIIGGRLGATRDIHDVPTGSLGGIMRCGVITTDSAPAAVCGWADYDGLGVAMFSDRDTKTSADLLRAMLRGAQQRG